MNPKNMSPLRCAGSLAIVQRIHEANLLTMKLRCVCVFVRLTAALRPGKLKKVSGPCL